MYLFIDFSNFIMRVFPILLFILLIFSGCAENRHLRKQSKAQKKMLEISLEYPELFDLDTVYQIVEKMVAIPVESIVFDKTGTLSETKSKSLSFSGNELSSKEKSLIKSLTLILK